MPKALGPTVKKIVTALVAVVALVLILMWMAGAFREKIEPGIRELGFGEIVFLDADGSELQESAR